MDYDFSGWATRNNIQCSDGRTIMRDAFKENDGQKVPLVWNHQHDDPNEVLGHALLENREEGVYAYCKFNDTESGRTAKALVVNGDVDKLSIYANKLKSEMNNVIHGCIREVSLVLAGANPGAFIDSVITHSADGEDEEEGVIYTDEVIDIASEEVEEPEDSSVNKTDEADGEVSEDNNVENPSEGESTEEPAAEESVEGESSDEGSGEEINHSDDKTVEDVFNTLKEDEQKMVNNIVGQIKETGKFNDSDKSFKTMFDGLNNEQQECIYALVGKALDKEENNEEKGEETKMKHNVFDNETKENTLSHSAFAKFEKDVIADAKRCGSMKESFLAHAEELAEEQKLAHSDTDGSLEFGADNDYSVLFPDAVNLDREPRVIEKDQDWVAKVMADVKHSPFSRVKNTLGRMNEETARAKGYIKGKMKKNIAMSFLNRVTTPTTVYIKNDIDRDDVIDITDFSVVDWQKREMRKALNRELALAMLLGDGRDISDEEKINEQNIRPVVSDNDMYTIKYEVKDGVDYNVAGNSHSENDSVTKGVIRAAIRARKEYKGSGRPTLYTTEDLLTDMLLIEDQNGRTIYDSVEKLATALRVKEIVTVPEMENEKYKNIYGIIVNMNDYTAGADKGGNVNLFDDFDIDYNKMKYLMETRMSGALTVPYSAIALYKEGGIKTASLSEDSVMG